MTNNTQNPIFSIEIIHELLNLTTAELDGLRETYALMPATRCKRKTHCCAMLPEITLLEALAAFKRLKQESAALRRRFVGKIVTYFFINPAKITACPFLEENSCMIYDDRFFGCRAYGLWSNTHYEEMTRQNRQAKLKLGQQWQKLGITLPEKVTAFQTPYCSDVEVIDGNMLDDNALVQIATDIETLSNRLSPWHQTFNQMYFADLSFLATAMMVDDVKNILRIKVDIVRDYISEGCSETLAKFLDNIPDILKNR